MPWILLAAGCAGAGGSGLESYPWTQRENFEVLRARCTPCHNVDRALSAAWEDRGRTSSRIGEMRERYARALGASWPEGESVSIERFLDFHARQEAADPLR